VDLPIFRRMLSYLGFSAIASAVALLTSYVTAWLMAPSELGRVGVLLSIFFLVGPVVSLSAETLVLLKKVELTKFAYIDYRRRYLGVIGIVTVIFTAVLIISYQLHAISLVWYAALPTLGALRALSSLTSMEFVIESRSQTYGFFIVASAVINLVVTYCFLTFFGSTAPVRLLALIAGETATVLLRYKGSYQYLIPALPRWRELRATLRFGMPLVVSVLPAWFFNEADKYYMARKLGLSIAGSYVAACTLAGVVQLFNQALVNSLTPRIYSSLSAAAGRDGVERARRDLLRSLHIGAGILFLIGLSASLVALFVGARLLPPRYAAALPLVPFALFALVFNGIYRVIAIPIEYFRLTTLKTACIFLAGGVAFCIYQKGFEIIGPLAAPTGVIVGYGVLALMLYCVVFSRTRRLLLSRKCPND
jgi:O-antigen/teichoic acid export membrane protein